MVPPLAAAGGARRPGDALRRAARRQARRRVCRRVGQPTIVGEILAGVLIGPVGPRPRRAGRGARGLRRARRRFLLFWVGLETRLSDMRAVGGRALRVGAARRAGAVRSAASGSAWRSATALRPQPVPRRRAGGDQRRHHVGGPDRPRRRGRRATRTILGAAIVDDILALVLLSVASGSPGDGVDVVASRSRCIARSSSSAFIARGRQPPSGALPRAAATRRASLRPPLLPAVLLCLGLAALAGEIGLAAIIGAFLAGMIVAETKDQRRGRGRGRAAVRVLPAVLLRVHRSRGRTRCARRPRHARAARRGHRARHRHEVRRRWIGAPRHGPARPALVASAWCRAVRSGSSSPASAAPPGHRRRAVRRDRRRCRSSRR